MAQIFSIGIRMLKFPVRFFEDLFSDDFDFDFDEDDFEYPIGSKEFMESCCKEVIKRD